ncbi:MAG: hypothetical protein LRY39_00775 [Alphaproteobacteria bacterium]|nr:hypothetical protein [Alphaproteobacteria bacterium]
MAGWIKKAIPQQRNLDGCQNKPDKHGAEQYDLVDIRNLHNKMVGRLGHDVSNTETTDIARVGIRVVCWQKPYALIHKRDQIGDEFETVPEQFPHPWHDLRQEDVFYNTDALGSKNHILSAPSYALPDSAESAAEI